jgi:hypothetical protein
MFVLAFIALNLYWPTDRPMDPRWLALLTLIPLVVSIALVVLALRSDYRRLPNPRP